MAILGPADEVVKICEMMRIDEQRADQGIADQDDDEQPTDRISAPQGKLYRLAQKNQK